MASYVLDTSAILCVLLEENGVDRVVAILNAARSAQDAEPLVLLPFIARMETEYRLIRRLSAVDAERVGVLVENWPVHIVESSPEWRHAAARLKSTTPLSVADAWIASLALEEDCELVHKDPEFDLVSELRAIRLPYRPKN
jgi:predicted nucleic acid-binding protein